MFRMFHFHIWMNQRFLDVLQFCFVDQIATPFVSIDVDLVKKGLEVQMAQPQTHKGYQVSPTLHLLAPNRGASQTSYHMIELGPSSDLPSCLYIWNHAGV